MKRREFMTLLGGAVVAWPLRARAQPGTLPTIGYLGPTTRLGESQQIEAFVQQLRKLGWIEGRNVAIEYQWVEGHSQRPAGIAAEFVRLNVDVIVTWATANVAAAKQATALIPIVFVAADPVGTGLVASLAQPGGNATGLSVQMIELAAKRLEILREVVPDFRRLAIMAHVGGQGAMLEMAEVQATARNLGIEATTIELGRAEEIAPAFDKLKGRAEALYVCTDPLVNAYRARIAILAVGARLATMYGQHIYVEAGGLVSYGPNIPDLFRRAADFVDKILRGTKPGDIPVEQPTKFDLTVNLTTAKALGLEVPPTLLSRADEVIE
ncbi:MAG: ABC transporter substrate-binding protein [Xanthobacteraceae bacterium]